MSEVVYTTGSWLSNECETGYCDDCDDPQCMCPHHVRRPTGEDRCE